MSDQLIIRTMKDDIAEMNSAPVAVPPPQKRQEKKETPVFLSNSKPKEVSIPTSSIVGNPKRKRLNILIGSAYIFLFFLIIGGGIYSYMRWGNPSLSGSLNIQELSLSQIIPKNALLFVDYNLETENNRIAIKQLWSERSGESVNGVTNGNPTNLLDISDVTHLYYLVMPDIQTPFLITKKSQGIEEYVSQHRELQSIEKGGWYVLHTANIDQYVATLTNEGAEEQSFLLNSGGNPNYLIQYAMNSSFVSQQFNALAASTIGLSQRDGLIFQVVAPTTDGTIRASSYVAGEPSGDGPVTETSELISLIPSDLTFGHVGLSLTADMEKLQSETSILNGDILAQPAVRQFISLFSTPYAIFERKGADGVRDIGLIVTLPSSLRANIKTGEPIVEQAMSALVPLVVGRVLGIQVVFNDGLYNAVPLRYVNINGQTQALDYTIGDNFLMVSSSREGMATLIDTSLSGKQGISLEEPWKGLGEKASDAIANKAFSIGILQDPVIRNLLPVSSSLNQVPLIVSSDKTSTGTTIQAVLLSK